MYFKITDKKSEAFTKINAFLEKINEINNENHAAIQQRTGIKYKQFVGGESVHNLTTRIQSIKPSNPLQSKVAIILGGGEWKPDKEYAGFYTPNKKTKRGRDLADFLNDLPRVTWREENALYGGAATTRKVYHFGYKVRKDGTILIDNSNRHKILKLIPGMIEITYSEHQLLSGGKK